MNSLTQNLPRTGEVVFVSAPQYGEPQLVGTPTRRLGRDSSGDEYIYQRRSDTRCIHRLSWQSATRAMLDDLLLFHQLAEGARHDITWADHLGNCHVVKFPREPISFQQTGYDRYSIKIGLLEQIRMALIDENGLTLIDENGEIITY